MSLLFWSLELANVASSAPYSSRKYSVLPSVVFCFLFVPPWLALAEICLVVFVSLFGSPKKTNSAFAGPWVI